MSDLISRQAAIDAILAINDYGNSDRANALGLAEFAITTLPSAEPKIIHCKDCEWFGKAGCAISIVDDTDKPKETDFCSFAERAEE